MSPSEQIDNQIKNLPDWEGELFVKLRQLIHQADPEIVEDWKWDTAVFVHKKMVCAIGGFNDHLKINFFKGASLKDPDKLFNAGLEAKTSRAIDFYEGNKIDEAGLKDLIGEAVAQNSK